MLEGYGITECSPVVAGNHPGNIRHGTVGQPLRGVEVVRRPSGVRNEPLPTGRDRHACWSAALRSFRGYLNYDGPDPFLQHNGHRWYLTGDLGGPGQKTASSTSVGRSKTVSQGRPVR